MLRPVGEAKSKLSKIRKRVYQEARFEVIQEQRTKRQTTARIKQAQDPASGGKLEAETNSISGHANRTIASSNTIDESKETMAPTIQIKPRQKSATMLKAKSKLQTLGPASDEQSLKNDIIIGINDVSKALEGMLVKPVISQTTDDSGNHSSNSTRPHVPKVQIVFLCRGDLDPPHLYSHIPTLVSLANVAAFGNEEVASNPILLCPLNTGAEEMLSNALHFKRVGCLAIKV